MIFVKWHSGTPAFYIWTVQIWRILSKALPLHVIYPCHFINPFSFRCWVQFVCFHIHRKELFFLHRTKLSIYLNTNNFFLFFFFEKEYISKLIDLNTVILKIKKKNTYTYTSIKNFNQKLRNSYVMQYQTAIRLNTSNIGAKNKSTGMLYRNVLFGNKNPQNKFKLNNYYRIEPQRFQQENGSSERKDFTMKITADEDINTGPSHYPNTQLPVLPNVQ